MTTVVEEKVGIDLKDRQLSPSPEIQTVGVVVVGEAASSPPRTLEEISHYCLEDRLRRAINRPELASLIERLRDRGVSRLSDVDTETPQNAYFFVISIEEKSGNAHCHRLWIRYADDQGQHRRNFITIWCDAGASQPSPGDLLIASVSVKNHWKQCQSFKKVA